MERNVRKFTISKKATEAGFTLVELMVAMTISLLVGLVVLEIQAQLYRKSFQLSMLTTRQNEERTALSLLLRDASTAGYGMDWGAPTCDVTLSYGNGQPQALYPVWSTPATSTSGIPFTSLQTGYPAAGSGISSDIFFTTVSPSLSSGQTGSTIRVTQFGTTQSSSGLGAAHSSQLPLSLNEANNPGVSVGNTMQVRVELSGYEVCYQVPIAKITQTGQALYVSSLPSNSMPSSGYSGFDSALSGVGISQTISDSDLLHSTVTSEGTSSGAADILTAYYVGYTSGMPALIRTQVNTATGAILSNQPIAAGVVSLQTAYSTGNPSARVSWSSVQASGNVHNVQDVQFAMVIRTLNKDYAYTSPASIAVPGFSPYPVPASDRNYHYTVVESSAAFRNLLWSPAVVNTSAASSSNSVASSSNTENSDNSKKSDS